MGLKRGETSDSDPQRALKGMLSQHAGLWTLLRDDGKDVLSLDREMFRGAVQSGLGSMAAEDIDVEQDASPSGLPYGGIALGAPPSRLSRWLPSQLTG